jgi:hypothetical protein
MIRGRSQNSIYNSFGFRPTAGQFLHYVWIGKHRLTQFRITISWAIWMLMLNCVICSGTFRCSYFVCIWIKFCHHKICHQFIGIFPYNIHFMNGASSIPRDVVISSVEIEKFLSQILQCTGESSSTTNSIKWYYCGRSFFTISSLAGYRQLLISNRRSVL